MSDRRSASDSKADTLPHVIRPRLFLGSELLVGPGKIDLLRAVRETGSISAAARATGMGYKRAWILLDELREACGHEVVSSTAGGSGGGGAEVTGFGASLIGYYGAIEAACAEAAAPHLKKLRRLLASHAR
jgi:molybdate transport system regulatory protein